MKLNQWTVALTAAGVVTFPALMRADDQKPEQILTALSSTTLSGYVDTSAQWNFGTGNANNPPYSYGGPSKADGFNLDVVDLALDRPQDDTDWAAGYHVELWLGPDGNALGTQSSGIAADFAIRQAYITLRTPICNGINWKIGVFDTIIGYESFSSPLNPNYSRSYAFTIEPSQHTGILASYQVNDEISLLAGVADTVGPQINGRANIESYKTYMGSVTFTCPTNAGWSSGSTITVGVVNGFNANDGEGAAVNQTSFYAGATLSTPLPALKLGASVDYLGVHKPQSVEDNGDGTTWVWDLYATYQATEKMSLNLRGEYVDLNNEALDFGNVDISDIAGHNKIEAVTATLQYDLWKNVLSRVEFRWDHIEHGPAFGGLIPGEPNRNNAYMLAANVIYKF
jgi:hypothetical protein